MNDSSSDLTLPGDIPNLLRRCSPVVLNGESRFVKESPFAVPTRIWLVGDKKFRDNTAVLDLNDPTGRAHAAWWAREHLPPSAEMTDEEDRACQFACFNVGMDDTEVGHLRALVLRLAGRS